MLALRYHISLRRVSATASASRLHSFCPWTRQVSLPAGRRRLARTCQSASSRLSKPAPRTHPIRSLCEEVGACGGHIFFASGVAWTHAGRRFFLVTRTRVSNAVAREPAARIFFHDRMIRQWRALFLRCRAMATAVAVARAASCGTQRASPVNARMPTCQSDGVDLSPANLSCPEV